PTYIPVRYTEHCGRSAGHLGPRQPEAHREGSPRARHHCCRSRRGHDRPYAGRSSRSETRRVLAGERPNWCWSALTRRLGRVSLWSLSGPRTCQWEARQMKIKKRVIGKQVGPEPHQFDPYDGMSDKKFESEVLAAHDAAKQRQKAIS